MEFDNSNLTAHLAEKQLLLWTAQRRAARERFQKGSPFQFLTIARDEGSLEDEIAQGLSRHLGWHVFDKEIVSYIAQNGHVSENLVRELDQKAQGILEDTIASLLNMSESVSFESNEYREALLRTLVCLATHGCAILIGRGGNFALKEYGLGFNVRLTASPEIRAQRLKERWKVTLKAARERMRADDEERRKFIHQYYRQNYDDMSSYDLICNTDRLPADRIIASILAAMKQP
jgi:cytidylate kinase